MLHLSISLRALVFVLLVGSILFTGSDVARGAPSAVDLNVDGNMIFSAAGEGSRDIRTGDNDGGLRFYSGTTLTNPPQGAAIQFFGNDRAVFNGQAYIDSGAHNNAALIFRTAGTGQSVGERMRITADGKVGIGTASPQEQLQLTGNLRLPATTATTGIIRSGTNTLLHTFGTSNFFVGIGAGNLTTTGLGSNTGIGTNALATNTTGDGNTATGVTALRDNTTGFFNTAIGGDALQKNTDGNNNTATGQFALRKNTTGGSNTAIGQGAMGENTTGNNNTAIGQSALIGNTTGVYNVAVGSNSGNGNTTGSTNVFIGQGANAGAGNLTNATAIGSNAIVGASNSLVLGSGANVGIGTTTPISTLQVVGGYLQFSATSAGAPIAADCNADAERGRLVIDTTNNLLYVCNGATRGWDSLALTN